MPQVLSDTEKRQIYDLDGVEGLERHEKGQNAPANPFDMLFGGGGGGRRKGPDVNVDMEVRRGRVLRRAATVTSRIDNTRRFLWRSCTTAGNGLRAFSATSSAPSAVARAPRTGR